MRKKRVLFSMAVAVTALVSSCSKESDGPEIPGGGEFGSPSIIDIILVNNEVPSKAIAGSEDGTPEENRIKSLEFYVYDSEGKVPDPEVGRESETAAGNGYLKISGENLSMNQKIRVSAGKDKKFLVVANADLGPIQTGETFEALKARLSNGEFKATSQENNTRVIPATGLEMSGFNTVTIDDASNNNQVYITVKRLVSKINSPVISATELRLTNIAQIHQIWGEETSVTLSSKISFTFKGYALVNGTVKSTVSFTGNTSGVYFDPKNSPWDNWIEKNRIQSSFNANGGYTNNYSGKKGDSWFLAPGSEPVYVYENMPKRTIISGTPGYDLLSVYALIIEGEVSADGVNPVTRYWRVDLTRDDIYHIMRNCVYKVTIDKITTPGYGTPQEAEEKPGIVPDPDDTVADFVIKVDQWNINEYTSEM